MTPPSEKELQEMEQIVNKAGELAESSYDFRGAYACDVASLLQYVRELKGDLEEANVKLSEAEDAYHAAAKKLESARSEERKRCSQALCGICETGESFGIKLKAVPVYDLQQKIWWHEPAKGNPRGVGHQQCLAGLIWIPAEDTK